MMRGEKGMEIRSTNLLGVPTPIYKLTFMFMTDWINQLF